MTNMSVTCPIGPTKLTNLHFDRKSRNNGAISSIFNQNKNNRRPKCPSLGNWPIYAIQTFLLLLLWKGSPCRKVHKNNTYFIEAFPMHIYIFGCYETLSTWWKCGLLDINFPIDQSDQSKPHDL